MTNIIHQKRGSIVSFQIHHNLVIDFLVHNINAYIQIATIHLLVFDISLIGNHKILIMDFLFSYVVSDFSCRVDKSFECHDLRFLDVYCS